MRNSLVIFSLALMLGGAAAQAQPAPQPGRSYDLERREGRAQPGPEQLAERRAELCQGLHARAAGRLAEMEVRLNLTAAQRGAFERWRAIRLAAAKTRADACASAPLPRERQAQAAANPAERLSREEQMLRQRLADISAERPALEALYNGLSPEQREKFRPDAGQHGQLRRGGPRGRMVMRLHNMETARPTLAPPQ